MTSLLMVVAASIFSSPTLASDSGSADCSALLCIGEWEWVCVHPPTGFMYNYCNAETGEDPFEWNCGLPG